MTERFCYYKCCKCEKKFARPEPGGTDCPHCKHPYVKWLNYGEKFIEKPIIFESSSGRISGSEPDGGGPNPSSKTKMEDC